MAGIAVRLGAGVAGGVAAGSALSALFLVLERSSGTPSDIVRLGRRAASALGSPYLHQNTLPAPGEQLRCHGGHLLLSAAMGATWPVLRDLPRIRGVPALRGLPGGLLFGAAWYGLLRGAVGPRSGLTPTPRREGLATASWQLGLHAGFGLVTALVCNTLVRPR